MIRLAVRAAVGLAVLVLAAGGTGEARAGYLGTYAVDGDVTGTFMGKSFTNAHITFTFTYDTDNIMSGFFGPPDPVTKLQKFSATVSGTGTVSVAGVGSANLGAGGLVSFSSNSFIAPGAPSDLDLFFAGMSLFRPDHFHVDGGFGDPLADYDLRSSFGPIFVGFIPPPPPTGTLFTDAGDLVVTDFGPPFAFVAQLDVVPEPASWLLLSLGGLGAAGYRWRRKRAAVAF